MCCLSEFLCTGLNELENILGGEVQGVGAFCAGSRRVRKLQHFHLASWTEQATEIKWNFTSVQPMLPETMHVQNFTEPEISVAVSDRNRASHPCWVPKPHGLQDYFGRYFPAPGTPKR
jgi:hypothetical protein